MIIYTFPEIVGQKAEMFVDGKWIQGRIVEGYRFRDGLVTIETDDGTRYWCGQDRTDVYRKVQDDIDVEKEIKILSDLRSKYSIFNPEERPKYDALNIAIEALKLIGGNG